MSLGEIIGTKKDNYDVYGRPVTKNVPAPAYIQAVEQVRTAPSGTLISRAPRRTIAPALPQVVPNAITDPLGTILGITGGFLYGTPEQKAQAMGAFVPAQQTTESYDIAHGTISVTETMKDIINNVVTKGSQTEEGKKFWSTPTLGPTPIELPKIEFPDILGGLGDLGKYVLIGGAILLAIILFSKK